MVKKNNIFESLNLNLFNNKSGKKSYNGILIIAGILGALFLMGVVFAFAGNGGNDSATITLYNGTTILTLQSNATSNFSIGEGVNTYFFINVSNPEVELSDTTGTAITNITNVSITFDRGVVIVSYNFSAARSEGPGGNVSFNNESGGNQGHRFSWGNSTGGSLIGVTAEGNGGNGTFEFNTIIDVPGTYNITVDYGNTSATGGIAQNISYIRLTVNDSTAPYNVTAYSNSTGLDKVTPVYRSYPTTRANISNFAIYVELNARDFYELGAGGLAYNGQLISTVNFTLYNGTAGVMNSTLITRMGAINDSFAVNFTNHIGGNNLSDDHYYINVTTVNDSKGNINYTGLGFNITVDRTAPTITAAKASSSTSKQIVLDLTISDTTSGIAGKQCTATGGGTEGITMSGTTGTQTATQIGLSCSSAYTYTVNCVDHSGNTGSKEVTVSTDTCSGGGSSGGTGGGAGGSDVVGSASSAFWVLTYNEATTDLNDDSDGVSVNLAERYRAKVKVDTKLYYVGVVDTTDTTAKINVTTFAQDKEATLSVGDVKKFDVNADDKYDISVTLNGVDSATGKADLSVIYIQEPVSAEEQAGVEEQAGTEATTPTTAAKSKAWIWIVVVLAVLVIAGAVFFGKRKSRFKNYGF